MHCINLDSNLDTKAKFKAKQITFFDILTNCCCHVTKGQDVKHKIYVEKTFSLIALRTFDNCLKFYYKDLTIIAQTSSSNYTLQKDAATF